MIHVITRPGHWIEGEAVRQLEGLTRLAGVVRAVGLPDLHPGRGYPIGAAVMTEGFVHPHLVGNDIGCGMSLYRTDLSVHRTRIQHCERRLRGLDDAWDGDVADWLARHDVDRSLGGGLGTIGGGNHFAELQRTEEVHDAERFASLGLDADCVLLLVHSGSRGFGESILSSHVRRFKADPLPLDSSDARAYLAAHDQAVRWARANRALIAHRIATALRCELQPVLDVVHNFVEPQSVEGRELLVHRKGAAAARGPVVLPGSRGAWTYVIEPTNATLESGWSLAHGAGRRWKRTESRGKLGPSARAESLERTSLGSHVMCKDKDLLFEEAPQAYKNVDAVLECLVESGLARSVAKLRPMLTYKTARGSGDRE